MFAVLVMTIETNSLSVDEAWQVWLTPFFMLLSFFRMLFPAIRKEVPSTPILHKYAHSLIR